MANPKLAAKVTEVLGCAPEDAVLMLPRDGQNWVAQSMDKGPKKFSIGGLVADAIVKTEVRPGGHVLGMPFPPEGPVVWAMTPTAAICIDTRAGFGKWIPERVFASFDYSALDRFWHEKVGMAYYAVHVTMRDGNHWEFSIGKRDLPTWQAMEQEINGRAQRAGGGQAPQGHGQPQGNGQPQGAPQGQPAGQPGQWQPGPPQGQPQGQPAGQPGQWQPGPPQGQPHGQQGQPGQWQPGPPQGAPQGRPGEQPGWAGEPGQGLPPGWGSQR
ncbi:hypothetical protein ACPYO6_05500 [Georgenia sp. Z1344]|uniref:hypothetical protein n=1 Tax=Georgenia sp. Z1344 TaxID=3416706 RepID=UPI003CF6FB18